VRESVEKYTGIPVVGAIPRSRTDYFPQRHLGVTPFQEHEGAVQVPELLAEMAESRLDLDKIENLMAELDLPTLAEEEMHSAKSPKVKIGILKDAAFQFYYPENLQGLVNEGAELVEINAMTATVLPEIDGLYIGGGFPETSAGLLSENAAFRASVRQAAESGLPVYAECGGLIYLGESIMLDDKVYPLAGVFPVRFGLHRKPQAHGYTELNVVSSNPYYETGSRIKGHEFRYSTVLSWDGKKSDLVFEMDRGVGFKEGRDGLVYKNVLALYTHIHALSTPGWAVSFVSKACEFRKK
jgi:cobyrinic acid a,c-diamide synthase